MMSHVDVLRVRRANGLCDRCLAPSISSKTVIHVALKPGNIKLHTYRINIAFFMVSPSAKHRASVVESVTHFQILSNQYTHAPAHITAHGKLTSCQWPCWHSPRQQVLPAQAHGLSET